MSNKKVILEILDEYKINYFLTGKNVSTGQTVNIRCPFCDDTSDHLGIFFDSMLFHCWRCNRSGHFSYLLSRLLSISIEEAEAIINRHQYHTGVDLVSEIESLFGEQATQQKEEVVEVSLPPHFELITEKTDYLPLQAYLKRRKLNLSTLIEYRCGICRVGPYTMRLIIPVYYQNRLVGYQGADLTGRAKTKYLSSHTPIKNYLYNYDNVDKRIIIVEGVLDCWRVGKDCVATFGTGVTKHQRNLILRKKPETLIICFDGDAYLLGLKEAAYYHSLIPDIRVVQLPEDEDPDSLGDKIGDFIERAERFF